MGPLTWIAYDPSIDDHKSNREQFNGVWALARKPDWLDTWDEFQAKQGIDVPQVGDVLALRMGHRTVVSRRLEQPEYDDSGNRVTGWYWTIIVG